MPKTIEEIAKQYEGNSCMEATRYRQTRTDAPLTERLAALRADVEWYREHSMWVVSVSERDLYALERSIELSTPLP